MLVTGECYDLYIGDGLVAMLDHTLKPGSARRIVVITGMGRLRWFSDDDYFALTHQEDAIMWTLVLFTLFGNPNSGGGTNANVTTFHFTSQQSCLEAAKTLESQGVFANSAPTSYQIFGKCISSVTVLK
jgi:hypothetical protein